jgi:lipoyl(octanoyl) transferase
MQQQLLEAVALGMSPDTLLLLEHPHVYTQGRVTDKSNLLFTPSLLEQIGAETFEIDRGGDVTYHGPGQLVGYPILNLSRYKEDLGWYLRALEESIIRTLATYDVKGYRVQGRTGVWVGASGSEEKICAIGIRATRWCTMHGFAFNVNTDLTYYRHIIPCGIGDKPVTSLEKLLDRSIEMREVKERYQCAFREVFEVDLVSKSLETLRAALLAEADTLAR